MNSKAHFENTKREKWKQLRNEKHDLVRIRKKQKMIEKETKKQHEERLKY
ncbi:16357_t:CDS:2 [Funneliformis geosporum]|uniref:16357_t:CDS:1 n=1 Tax=Funneliformis geosporum TaxID=1117311 RepID=A0A9W4SLA0_9GLOM|nr:16357_t:CDS:2 [Funneliformis geosporum]